MKTFRCTNCGHELRRPTQPYSCPQCGRQAVGLFKLIPGGGQPAQPDVQPPAGGVTPVQTGAPPAQPTVPPTQPGVPPAQHGGVSPIAAPPPPPGTPAASQTGTPPAAQPTQPPAQPAQQPPSPRPPQAPAQRTQQPPAQPTPQSPRQPARPTAQRPPSRKPQKPQAAPPPLPQGGKGGKPRPATPPAARPPARPKAPQAAPPDAARPRAKSPRRAARPEPPKPKPPTPRPKIRPEVIRPKEFVWAYPDQPPYNVDARPMRNAPAVDPEGRIVFCAQGRLLAVEDRGETSPKILWEYVIGSHVPGPVVVAPDGSIRAHSGDGFLHCVSSVGKQVWAPAHVGEPLGWAAPVCDEEGNTYISDYDGGLIRVDNEGKMGRKPYFRSRRKFDSAGVILGGVLYIGAEDGYLFAIRLGPNQGESTWDHAAEQGYTGGYLNSSPAVTEDGVLVVAARDDMLYGFAPSGAAVWATRMPGMLLGSPVIDPHGHIYVGISQAQRGQEPRGLLVCVDGNSHKIRWQYRAAGPVESTPVVGDDDTVYFGDDSGTIHAVDTRGTAKWTARVEAAIRSAGAIIAPQRLAFGLDDDTLVVLRCSSQSLAPGAWPKIACTLAQTGMAPAGTGVYGALEASAEDESAERTQTTDDRDGGPPVDQTDEDRIEDAAPGDDGPSEGADPETRDEDSRKDGAEAQ